MFSSIAGLSVRADFDGGTLDAAMDLDCAPTFSRLENAARPRDL